MEDVEKEKTIAEELMDSLSTHPYDKCVGNLYKTHTVNLRKFSRKRLPPKSWVDTKRFVTASNRIVPHAMFELFGEFSGQDGREVRETMIGWAYDNFRSLEDATNVAFNQRGSTFSVWLTSMADERTPGDEITLFVLAKMYRRHVFVYTNMFWWTTMLYTLPVKEHEVAELCDVHLVYIKPNVFGEVKYVKQPSDITTTPVRKVPVQPTSTVVSTDQVKPCSVDLSKCVRNIEPVPTPTLVPPTTGTDTTTASIGENVETDPKPNLVQTVPTPATISSATPSRSSTRKKVKPVKYVDFLRDIGVDVPAAKKKQSRVQRKPSRARQAARKHVTRPGPSQTLKTTTQSANTMATTEATREETQEAIAALLSLGTDLDSNEQTVDDNALLMPILGGAAPTDPPMANKNTESVPSDNQPVTTMVDVHATQKGELQLVAPTVVIPENVHEQEDTTTPVGDKDVITENDNHNISDETTDVTKTENTEKTDQTDPPALPAGTVIGTAIKVENRLTTTKKTKSSKVTVKTVAQKAGKKLPTTRTLEMKEYKLKRKNRPVRKIKCEMCKMILDSVKDYNDHYMASHPPTPCPDCNRRFVSPRMMKKHRYVHFETMYECAICDRGFSFKSEFDAHRKLHIGEQGLACFKANCGQRFKRMSELQAHLRTHRKHPLKCPEKGCSYTNYDIRNLRAHSKTHSDTQPYFCPVCGQRFKWQEQKKRHMVNCTE